MVAFAHAACSNASPTHEPDASFLTADSAVSLDAISTGETAVPYSGGTYTNAFDGLPTVAMSSAMLSQTLTGKGPFPFSSLSGAITATGMDG